MSLKFRIRLIGLTLLLGMLGSYLQSPQATFATVVLSNYPPDPGVGGQCFGGSNRTAVVFTTPATGSPNIDRVTAYMNGSTPSSVVLDVYTNGNTVPGVFVGNVGSVAITPNASVNADYVFDAPGVVTLSPNTTYWLVAIGTFFDGCSAFWLAQDGVPSGLWTYNSSRHFFSGTWNTLSSHYRFQIEDEDVAPTETPITPTDTPITPTDTLITPTETPITPTDTPITPTNTPITPTNTPITPTDTPITPTLTPTCAKVAVPPTLQSPSHRTHTTDTTPQFTWSSVAGALSYRLMVYTEDRSFEYKKRTFNTTYTLTNAEALTPSKYLWRVRTQDQGCNTWTAWSTRNTLFID